MEKTKTGRSEDLIRIAIVGPESTGKSVLSEQLAKYFNTSFVPEVARRYLSETERKYNLSDIDSIARLQVRTEDGMAKTANGILFCDTNLVVTKIWAEFVFNDCPHWIEANISKRKYDLHLLTDIDLPWEPDPQREHPHRREELFLLYRSLLGKLKVNYMIVSGSGESRFLNALKFVNEVLTRS